LTLPEETGTLLTEISAVSTAITGVGTLGALTVSGATTIASASGVVSIARTGAATTVKGSLNVKEAVTLDKNTAVKGTLDVDEAVTLKKVLDVTGDTTIKGTVTLAGDHDTTKFESKIESTFTEIYTDQFERLIPNKDDGGNVYSNEANPAEARRRNRIVNVGFVDDHLTDEWKFMIKVIYNTLGVDFNAAHKAWRDKKISNGVHNTASVTNMPNMTDFAFQRISPANLIIGNPADKCSKADSDKTCFVELKSSKDACCISDEHYPGCSLGDDAISVNHEDFQRATKRCVVALGRQSVFDQAIIDEATNDHATNNNH